jgi:flagellar protein FlbD
MIRLTRLNRESFYLNPDLIQEMETTPDTVLTLSSGVRVVVRDAPERVIDAIVEFKRRVLDPERPLSAVSLEHRLDR